MARRLVPGLLAPALAAAAIAGAPVRASAGEVFAGVFDHGLFVEPGVEHGADLVLGYRTAPLRRWTWLARPEAQLFVSANTEVSTHFAAVGLSWPLTIAYGGRLYVRPGFGVAYTTGAADVGNSEDPSAGPAERARRLHLARTRIDFGSKVLFEEELAFGYRFAPRWALEAAYTHLSNGQILHRGKNQGLDDVGLRVAYSF